jgi:hypothetical protein
MMNKSVPPIHILDVPPEQMRAEITDYNAALMRVNVLTAQGLFRSLPHAEAIRVALKEALRAMRRMIATERRPPRRQVMESMLGDLKRIHWHMLKGEKLLFNRAIGNN